VPVISYSFGISVRMMTLTLNFPDPVLRRLEATCQDIPTAVLEGFAADGYRDETLSRTEVGGVARASDPMGDRRPPGPARCLASTHPGRCH
jgi:hypothetical protein